MIVEKQNHTQVPNVFIDRCMPILSKEAVCVFLAICRKTIGWHKDIDRISQGQLLLMTPIKSVNGLKKALQELIEIGLISIEQKGKGKGIQTYYEINYVSSDNISQYDIKRQSNTSSDDIKRTSNISPDDTTKETYKENNINKDINIPVGYSPPQDNNKVSIENSSEENDKRVCKRYSSYNFLDKNLLLFLKEIIPLGGFGTILPQNGNPPTATVLRIQDYINSLLDETFSENMPFDENWKAKNRIYFTLPRERVFAAIKLAVARWNKMKESGYWPENKRTMTRRFDEWLYNTVSKKSWFLYCYSNEPVPLQIVNMGIVISSIFSEKQKEDRDAAEKYRPIDWDELQYWRKIKELYNWYLLYEEILDIYNKGNWLCCATFGKFLDCITEFSKKWGGWGLSNFGYGNRTWRRFETWMKKEHGTVFELEIGTIERLVNEYDRTDYPLKHRGKLLDICKREKENMYAK